jgi:hypothetical protein
MSDTDGPAHEHDHSSWARSRSRTRTRLFFPITATATNTITTTVLDREHEHGSYPEKQGRRFYFHKTSKLFRNLYKPLTQQIGWEVCDETF